MLSSPDRASASAGGAENISQSAREQIAAILQEKASRTPGQKKMDSQLVHAVKHGRGEAFVAAAPDLEMDVDFLPDGRVLVDIDAEVTPDLLALIKRDRGTVVSSVPQFQAIRAQVTVAQLETLGESADVLRIRRAAKAFTNTGSVDSQGDTTHRAILARSTFGVSGAGITVGVLSDSCDYYTTSQTTGDLGPITILPGQSGIPGSGEGTAMMEIVHDLAPVSPLQFATAFISEAQFAQNILNLWSNGCKVVVDDVGYFDEPPFQDGVVARAVNTITVGGALYFSSAANSGGLDAGTSGTWEGDFVDGGAAGAPITESGRLHSFGATTYDTCASGGSSRRVDLFWSDPWGASGNDYDLFVLNSTGASVLRSSTGAQTGTQNPYEAVGTLNVGERIVILKYSGAARFIHLSTGRAVLTVATSGATVGHSAATNAFSTAAVSALTAYPNPFTGGAANPCESFSSDGLRHVFYNADGTAMTPGNFSSTGGAIRNKPDIAAADGVTTAVPGFAPFYGTSAAAPHAAAIAALLWSANTAFTPGQIRSFLTSTALDVNPAGYDRDTGYGLVMAYQALQAAIVASVAAGFTGGPTSGVAPLTVTFTNSSSGATNYSWTFGDGNTSAVVNPANTYSNAGTYSVALTAIGAGGTNILTRTNYIVVVAPGLSAGGTVAYYPTNYPPSALSTNRVGNVTMTMTGSTNLSGLTLTDGSYTLSNISTGGTYCITPSKTNDNPTKRGVSSFDAALIQAHILKLLLLDSPYKLLAADVSGDGIINSFDLAYIQAFNLSQITNFPAGLWRFVPADYVFPNPTNPWAVPTNRWYTNLVVDVTNGDFVAIKLGDVAHSWTAPSGALSLLAKSGQGSQALARNILPGAVFAVSQQTARPGETVTVGVTLSGFRQVSSAQFSLAWDPAVLRCVGTGDYGLRGLSAGSFGTTLTESGKLAFAWYDPEARGVTLVDGTVLFTAAFQVIGPAGSVSSVVLADEPIPQEVSVDFALAAFGSQDGSVAVVGPGVLVRNPGYSGGVFHLSVPTEKGRSYVLEFTDALPPANWTALPAMAGDGTVAVLVDPAPTNQQRFYRVHVQ